MQRRVINPWTWQQAQGWTWGIETIGAERVLYCAGQVPTDARGKVLHTGDMRGQLAAAFDNLEEVLRRGGYALGHVVRIDYYTTSAEQLMDAWGVVAQRMGAAECRAGGVLLEVSRLAIPELMVEIQAIAAR